MTSPDQQASSAGGGTADWSARMEDFSDNWNPMLVRETRRMLKSRTFVATFLLLILGCWLTCCYVLLDSGESLNYQESGRSFCRLFLSLLSIPICFVVPMSLFAIATEEHHAETLESLVITRLKPEQIVWGYMWCGLAHAGMYIGALLPFISFSYLLRGLGLMEILQALLVFLVFGTAVCFWGLMLGSCSKGTISRSFCSFLAFLGGVISCSVINSMIGVIFWSGSSWEWAGGLLCFLLIILPFNVIMFGIARQQFQLTDPTIRPFHVVLDPQGNVLSFKPDYHRYPDVHMSVPEWNQIQMSDRSQTTNPKDE